KECIALFEMMSHLYSSTVFCLGCSYIVELHSFPTRRSSDLKILAPVLGQEGELYLIDSNRTFEGWGDLLDNPVFGNSHKVVESIDRKSTRLNSSHVKISYAVFCLKKKKKRSMLILLSKNTKM